MALNESDKHDPGVEFLTTQLAFETAPILAEQVARAIMVPAQRRTTQEVAAIAAWNELTDRIQSGSDS